MKQVSSKPVRVVNDCKSSTQETEAGESEFKTSLWYTMSSRLAHATQYDPELKKTSKQTNKTTTESQQQQKLGARPKKKKKKTSIVMILSGIFNSQIHRNRQLNRESGMLAHTFNLSSLHEEASGTL